MLLKRHVAGYSLAGSSSLMEFDNGSGEDELAQLLDAVVGEKVPDPLLALAQLHPRPVRQASGPRAPE